MITQCRGCGSDQLEQAIDLGMQCISDFRDDNTRPPAYPLEVVWCASCTLAQLTETAPPADLYHPRYSFKSGVNQAIRVDLKSVVATALEFQPEPRAWLDIASNDGTLLSHVPQHVRRVGVDPLAQFAAEASQHADEIVVDFFTRHSVGGQFDVVTSVSMFYDLDDPNRFVSDVESVLAPGGIWVIQQNDLWTMLRRNSFDNISHEHVCYYSLTALDRLLTKHGLMILHGGMSDVNGGCSRVVVGRRGEHKESLQALDFVATEHDLPWRDLFTRFRASMEDNVSVLRRVVGEAREDGKTVYVYGASTRGGTIWQKCGFTAAELPYTVERNPDKVGKVFSCIGSRIISEQEARERRPDYMLVGPWWFADQFAERESEYLSQGGRLIVPLPEVRVISA